MNENCPYCEAKVKLIDSALIYNGRSYGPAWACSNYPKCDSYVGCHPNTTKPLGRLANKELRAAKMRAHKAFDPMWRKSKERREGLRSLAYRWLAQKLKIKTDECHIGMFDVRQCDEVVRLCGEFKLRVNNIQSLTEN